VQLSTHVLTDPATSAPPDPLTALLRYAVARARDPAVQEWLARLLESGECCSSPELTRPPELPQAAVDSADPK
jgi:hypothetical protein